MHIRVPALLFEGTDMPCQHSSVSVFFFCCIRSLFAVRNLTPLAEIGNAKLSDRRFEQNTCTGDKYYIWNILFADRRNPNCYKINKILIDICSEISLIDIFRANNNNNYYNYNYYFIKCNMAYNIIRILFKWTLN